MSVLVRSECHLGDENALCTYTYRYATTDSFLFRLLGLLMWKPVTDELITDIPDYLADMKPSKAFPKGDPKHRTAGDCTKEITQILNYRFRYYEDELFDEIEHELKQKWGDRRSPNVYTRFRKWRASLRA